ncbi:MAG: nickel pincer cofactor biosynthesis protein LarC [Peptococcaceae bacterium]|nr:nickel pincer cofactor biosynthesis protein LarC [Peptococcaceae bacterium]
MKTLYLDCFSGISGDMCLGALINAGADLNWLKSQLSLLPLSGWKITARPKKSHEVSGTQVIIEIEQDQQPHRHYSDIKDLVLDSPFSDKSKNLILKIFQRIAQAEGTVHQKPMAEVHFHEVGAVDSILDIVGTALALEYLNISEAVCSPIPTGSGQVTCRHGVLPIPAPATALLLKNIPIYGGPIVGELTTPTGAAIAAVISKRFGPLPEMQVEAIGYGFGSKTLPSANFLRIFIGTEKKANPLPLQDEILILEVNIDDMNPQFCGHVIERLYLAGALEAFITPVQMKKSRPGYVVTVLARPEDKDIMLKILFSETTTLGIRFRTETRAILNRKFEDIATPFGNVRVKTVLDNNGKRLRSTPEYEDCRQLALEKDLPIKDIYDSALLAAMKKQ